MKIQGLLKVIRETQFVSDNFNKREFVLSDVSSQYPQHITFQLTQVRCSQLDKFKIGADVTVHFNLKGREWTSPQGEVKYFNTLEAWKIEPTHAVNTGHESAQSDNYTEQPISGKDDLPF